MNRTLLLILFGAIPLLLAACGSDNLENTLGWEVESFETTTQADESLSTEDMEGKVWLANFIFTSCNTVCPPMTRNMAKIQDMLAEEGVNAEIVSFSVDPTVDKPQKLKEFGESHGADFSNWSFLTGYSQEAIQNFAKNSFKAPVQKTEGVDQVSHGTSFYLVNQEGIVVKRYSGNNDVQFEQIVEDTKVVAK